jgi:hypothetical protein
MHNKLRLLMGTTALLYLGPLLAGLRGFGWPVVPVFAAIFVLWLIVLRPAAAADPATPACNPFSRAAIAATQPPDDR